MELGKSHNRNLLVCDILHFVVKVMLYRLTAFESCEYIGSIKYVNEVPVSTKALKSASMAEFPTSIPIILMLYLGLAKQTNKQQ